MALSEVDFVEGALIVNAHVAGTVKMLRGFRSFNASFWLIYVFRDELNPVYQMAVNNGYTLYCQRSKEMIYRHEIGHKHEIGRKS